MRWARSLLTLALLGFVASVRAGTIVHNVRLWQAPDSTRLVFDVSSPAEYRHFLLQNPHRLVIDLDDTQLAGPLPVLDTSGPVVAGVRSSPGDKGVRIVIDLKTEVRPNAFALKPYEQYGHRLVIDLHDVRVEKEQASPAILAPKADGRDLVVAIDAGHGGEDPGAIGKRYRTREKDVVLAIARELYNLLAAAPGMKPVMIRDGDYYIDLGRRVIKADNVHADVFVSIHADSVPGRHARGSSVYALSERGASTVLARMLADKENAADFIGGAAAEVKEDDVYRVLLDLGQTAAIADSLELGKDVLGSLRTIGPLHANNVNQAGFAVLKSKAARPSILVETGFISNPDEERKLRDKVYQRRVAKGIFNGLKRAAPRLIARRSPGTPAVTTVAATPTTQQRHHVVKKGETLEQIARRYDVNVEALRFLNKLTGSELVGGLRLEIPRANDL